MKTLLGTLFACALVLSAADLTGKWTGTFTPAGPDAEQHSACLNLKHNGTELTGTAGPDEEQQMAISNGKVEGDRIRFDVVHPNGEVMKFDLRLVGERIQGDVSGEHDGEKRSAKLDVSRAGTAPR